MSFEITILVDNNTEKPGLKTEHGFSCYCRTESSGFVFDTGQTCAVLENASKLGVNLSQAESVVISHGHYDHTGGLAEVLNSSPGARLFLHPGAMEKKYRPLKQGGSKYLGTNCDVLEAIQSAAATFVTAPVQIAEGVFITGPVPRTNNFEDTGGDFYLDEQCLKHDPLIDDMSMYIRTKAGIVILTGCCHSGIVNTAEYVTKLCPQEKIIAIIGGLHLLNADDDRLTRTLEYIRSLEPAVVAPCHCTGEKATSMFKSSLPDSYRPAAAGTVLRFES